MIEYNNFKNSLKNLEAQYNNYANLDTKLPILTREAISESVIQRFKICFNTLGEILKKYLQEELGIADIGNSSKVVLRTANENDLFSSDIDKWLNYLEVRNNTSHNYSAEKAQAALDVVEDFLDDAIGLYQAMTGESWE